MRLLPREQRLNMGWTPYAWLVYLVFFVLAPVPAHADWHTFALRLLGVVVFLPLYFAGYWLPNLQKLWPIAGMCLIGAIFAPVNSVACTFFIYAASFVGQLDRPAVAARWLAVLLACICLESWKLHLPPEFWVVAVVFSLMTGAINIHFFQQRRSNAKLHLAQQEVERLAQTAERERIARDLHDLLGHTLSLIILKSELAGKLVEKNPAQAAKEIGDVERVGREALAQVREAVRGYQSIGLPDELRRTRETLATAGVETRIDTVDLPLTPVQTTALVLALREATTNIVRHAHARNCSIRLMRLPSGCQLDITDDGRGGSAPDGAGLNGMRERIEKLGGVVERRNGAGTSLHIRLPLAASGEVA